MNAVSGIFDMDMVGLRFAEAIVACVDGTDPDSGVAWECGWACARGVPVILFRTDFRRTSNENGVNIMPMCSAKFSIDPAPMGSTEDTVFWYVTKIHNCLRMLEG